MRSATTRLVASMALASYATAILVTQGSSCDDQCGNVLSATTGTDIVCDQSSYGSAAGIVMENCMNCELSSKYYSTSLNQTDQQWLLYNSRYALSYCLFGQPGNVSVADSPCLTPIACGALADALEYGNFTTSQGAYDYCTAWAWEQSVEFCIDCLRTNDQEYLGNMVVMLQTGCDQKPDPGSTISVSGGIFSNTLMNETSPTPTNIWTSTGSVGSISLGGIVGIAIGGFCFLLALAGFCIVCNGRRRRRAFLRQLEMHHKESGSGWPHPMVGGIVHRGPDINETPLSQKPLRGWDDSPQSATTSDPSYARYFSPYSSQYNSPVSAADTPQSMAQQWPQNFHPLMAQGYPSSFQEKAMQEHHGAADPGSSSQPMQIGLALGGDEKSLRTQPSKQGINDEQGGSSEVYELHEVSSAGGSGTGGGNMVGHGNSFKNRMAKENRAPVLQHPGYGRYSPDKMPPSSQLAHTMHGGLEDDDVEGVNQI